ncbi:methyltransferase domain-containing protein [Ornithinimicrobium cerasi]|uniref:23S rRNA m(5)U-747 methyltransferase n=1 Tax=Ornithinimicrobium cerasi TaxID=2248773 RepID=A0A285VJX3_9MICO|nr:methyltransferase domain-containing protein [Ornithinimicrobium cerasi]SOC54369.1 23S rRNA m(5)U-747 methyltransferase [Ornithinimicrobium cerasi]
MQCDYFDAGACRSCTLMGTGYAAQLAAKSARVRALLDPAVPPGAWLPSQANVESGFRNKAKLAVGGRRGAPTLGILDPLGRGVDLRHCGLHEPGLAQAVPAVADLVAASGLTPYDVPARQGELKHVLLTWSPDAELMARFVLRSPGQLPRVRELVPALQAAVPGTRVVSANVQPEHKAVLEGPEEIVLTRADTLPMRVNGIRLHLRTRSFFQTSTAVAAALYRQARDWAEEIGPSTVLDLYCGVGGFALHLAGPGRQVLGVEVAPEAVLSARASARELGAAAMFEVGDATAYLRDRPAPDLVVVNPPRRGIGSLADRLEASAVEHLVYSSCSPASLAADLRRMPSLRVERARLFDMFPQTDHCEVMVRLRRV